MPIVWTKGGHYSRDDFSSEADLEASIVEVQDLLFGTGRIYLDVKKKIGLKGVQQNIPDGYLLDLNGSKPKLFVVENELAAHDPLRHIAVQILQFSLSYWWTAPEKSLRAFAAESFPGMPSTAS